MKLSVAKSFALSEMNRYGLITDGWKFTFDKAKVRFGLCSWRRKTISLSKELVRLNDEHHVYDTVLHEIAHALVGPGNGHNRVWQRKAIDIGCDGNRCYSNVVHSPKGTYEYVCDNCGVKLQRFRKRKTKSACYLCCKNYNGGRFTDKYLLRLQ